jgi:molecular chaperone IbpA
MSLFWQSSVGFDRLFDLVNSARDDGDDYPLYDIARTGENQYQITLALAGFSPEQLAVTAEQSRLTVEAARSTRAITTTCTRGSRCGRSAAFSTWQTTSRSTMRLSKTAC